MKINETKMKQAQEEALKILQESENKADNFCNFCTKSYNCDHTHYNG